MPVRSKPALKTLKNVESSNLIAEDCYDSASKSSLSGMAIDSPIRSRDIFVGHIGDKVKYVVSAQNRFRYSGVLFGPDNSAAPGEAEIEY